MATFRIWFGNVVEAPIPPVDYDEWATCDNSSTSIEAIIKLLLIDCVECGDDNSIMSYIKSALVTDGTSLYLKTNVECGIRAGESGLDQLGIRVLYGDEDTEYAECDQFDSWESILKRLVTIGDDGLYYLNVI